MNLTCYAYKLPFAKPLVTSNRTYKNREGWILCLQEDNQQFIGEAAPLPGFSQEKMFDIKHNIEERNCEWKKLLHSKQPVTQLQGYYKKQTIPPSLQFALDSLAYQIEAYRNQSSVPNLLSNTPLDSSLAVNGLLSLMDDENTLSDAQNLVNAGFNTIKCKVGQNFKREKNGLQLIRKTFPKLNIRLDANQAWSSSEAENYLAELEPLRIQYCEEPLAQPTARTFKTLNNKNNIPLALDESLNRQENWQDLLPYCSVLVVKPMVVGSFQNLQNIQLKARKNQCELVLTSSLESSVGRGMVALLASGIGSKNYAHGLHTGHLLLQDTIPGYPVIKNGQIDLDTESAIIQANTQHLEELSTTIITAS